jgi:hypothetical protein
MRSWNVVAVVSSDMAGEREREWFRIIVHSMVNTGRTVGFILKSVGH